MELTRLRRFASWVWGHLHREHESYWWTLVVVLGWACLLAAATGLVGHFLTTDLQPLIVLAALAHLLMWGVVAALLLFLAARRWWAVFFALVLFSGVAATQAGLYISGAKAGDGPRLTVLQANLRLGRADPAALVRLVKARHVDVATTEELTGGEQAGLLAAGIGDELPYHFTVPLPSGAGGLGIWSRYPLSSTVNYPGYQLGVLSATVALPTQSVTVMAVHLVAPYPYPAGGWSHEIAAAGRVLNTVRTRSQAVVVGGDFNATLDNGQFRDLLTNGFADAADEVGAGYLPTYPADRWFGPVIAIDHVLTANVGSVGLASVSLPGSDHRGLVATVALS